jgi:hypothetical protein
MGGKVGGDQQVIFLVKHVVTLVAAALQQESTDNQAEWYDNMVDSPHRSVIIIIGILYKVRILIQLILVDWHEPAVGIGIFAPQDFALFKGLIGNKEADEPVFILIIVAPSVTDQIKPPLSLTAKFFCPFVEKRIHYCGFIG